MDTNVWLAGRLGRGLCTDLLALLVEEDAEILLDERVLAEFRRIAHDKFRVDGGTIDEAEIFFRRYTTVLKASTHPLEGIPDPDDTWIMAAALSARADLFVTGDKALLALKRVETLPVIDPRTAFLRLRGLTRD